MKIKDIKTPCYIVNYDEYNQNIIKLMSCFNSDWNNNVIYGYSVKTNHLPYLMNVAKNYGWYGEVVSNSEYEHVINRFNKNKIILNGPNKGKALETAILYKTIINIDNYEELKYIIKNKEKIKAKIGLRVNLDLEAYVPGETTVGEEIGRFGFDYENGEFDNAVNLLKENNIKLSGLHLHHSTTSRSIKIFKTISNKAVEIGKKYKLNEIDYIDIGGGYFGGSYFKNKPTFKQYSNTICSTLKKFYNPNTTTLIVEPGAAILATSCDYITSVINERIHKHTNIVTVDGTCLHINPFMKLNTFYPCTTINPLRKLRTNENQIIGGNTCMEMDRFKPRDNKYYLTIGSKLQFHCAGAYTMTHNSCFINVPPRIYINKDNKYTIIRNEKTELMAN